MTVAYFVTPHGFGHAARACAVMDALHRRQPALRFHIFTTVPRWFFSESLSDCFDYHLCECDIGLVQFSPLQEDLAATAVRLEQAPWRDPDVVGALARKLDRLKCKLVVADISPLGLRAARRARLPSVLVENFTWDWIYHGLEDSAGLGRYGDEIAADFASSNLHIQTRPVCRRVAGTLEVGPVARVSKCTRPVVRERLGGVGRDPMVLVSMGGVKWDYGSFDPSDQDEGPWVVVPGGAETERRVGRFLLLPFHSRFFHPDLVNAADVVVGKLGYSTVAETFHAGAAFAWIGRPGFPESKLLERFVEHSLNAREITEESFRRSEWWSAVGSLLACDRRDPDEPNGAAQAAAEILERFSARLDGDG